MWCKNLIILYLLSKYAVIYIYIYVALRWLLPSFPLSLKDQTRHFTFYPLLFNTPGDGKLHCLHLGEDFPFVFSSRQSPDISVVGFGQEEYIGSWCMVSRRVRHQIYQNTFQVLTRDPFSIILGLCVAGYLSWRLFLFVSSKVSWKGSVVKWRAISIKWWVVHLKMTYAE